MMSIIMTALIALSFIFALFTGNIGALSCAFLEESGSAVGLCISLAGVICLWSGVMRVAQSCGITAALARLFRPLLSRLFRGLSADSPAMQYITLNITANLLGLGNASTPLGIAAMRALAKEEGVKDAASHNMIVLAVLNTASLQLIPATAAALRAGYGSADPMEILPCVWIASAASVLCALTASAVLKRLSGRRA